MTNPLPWMKLVQTSATDAIVDPDAYRRLPRLRVEIWCIPVTRERLGAMAVRNEHGFDVTFFGGHGFEGSAWAATIEEARQMAADWWARRAEGGR